MLFPPPLRLAARWACLLLLLPLLSVAEPEQSVDFRFVPARWQTIICMPDDWLKSFVSDQGALGYDNGPVSLRLAISSDGSRVDFHLSAIDGRGSNGNPVIFFEKLKRLGFNYADGLPLRAILNPRTIQEKRR